MDVKPKPEVIDVDFTVISGPTFEVMPGRRRTPLWKILVFALNAAFVVLLVLDIASDGRASLPISRWLDSAYTFTCSTALKNCPPLNSSPSQDEP